MKYNRPTIYPPGSRKKIPAFSHWFALNKRCEPDYVKKYPTYEGCYCEWSSYEEFYDWVIVQKGYGLYDENDSLYNLDKDLLMAGNLVYSEETCSIIPPEINRFLVCHRRKDRDLPVGITIERGLFRAGYSNRNLGRFKTLEEAVAVYEESRQEQAMILAEKWVDTLSERAYHALINYNVRPYRNIND